MAAATEQLPHPISQLLATMRCFTLASRISAPGLRDFLEALQNFLNALQISAECRPECGQGLEMKKEMQMQVWHSARLAHFGFVFTSPKISCGSGMPK